MWRACLCGIVVLALVGCSSTTTDEGFVFFKDPQEFDRITRGLTPVEETGAAPATNEVALTEAETESVGTAARPQVITVGAKLTIYVEEDASLDRQIVVGADGVIEFPPLGRMPVEGLTTDELQQRIKKDLERDYFQTATVTVSMEKTSAGGGVIYILGSIGHQGPMAIPPGEDFTVTKVMLAAGAGGPFSDLSKVEIIRYGADGKKYKTRINVQRVIDRGEFEKDIPVVHGDWLKVPEKIFNF
jgi:protein involved in polysaccharide export with SLBB domain